LKDCLSDQRCHFTEFCLAKSIFAQKNKSDLSIERAQTILERLYILTELDKSLRTEIAAMYCFVLQSSSSLRKMKNFAWETVLLYISEEKILSENDIY
jgi:hypothetical protein